MLIKNNTNIIKSLRGGGTFYKQFKKVVNSNKTINYKNQNFIKFQINNFFAFSLIELSIVLIIIGLLVSGIIGGQSLIESAKVRNFINETNSWKQALYTFRVKYGRLPGDLNNDGFLGGWCGGNACPNGTGRAGESYSINSFPEPYNNKVQSSDAGAYIELYLNDIIDFKPDPENFVKPHIIVFPELSWSFHQFVDYKYSSNPNATTFVDNIKNLSVWLVSDVAYISKSSYDRICKKIDRKLDGHIMDEEWDFTGNFRYQPHTHKYGNRVGVNLMDL